MNPCTEVRHPCLRAALSRHKTLKPNPAHGAIACGRDDEIGTLEPNKAADILVVEGNHIENIEALRNVRMVGMVVRCVVVVRSCPSVRDT
ncbi:MAG: amidohydrolase family protein [Vicinamibacteria bacterium]|nr:amidohydrolase family protein [Vicinamibacteria bacterium]